MRGGGRKPYRQKGTGRARQGSTRTPLRRGGGTIFGPQPRDYSYKLPKKVKWLAMSSALAAKFVDEKITVIDELSVAEPRTKLVVEMLKELGMEKNVLMIVPEKNETFELAASYDSLEYPFGQPELDIQLQKRPAPASSSSLRYARASVSPLILVAERC